MPCWNRYVARTCIVEVCLFVFYENINSTQSESWGMSAKWQIGTCHCVSFVSSLFLTSLDDVVCYVHCFVRNLCADAKKKIFLYLWNVLNTLKTKINLHFVYIHLLLVKERGVRPLSRSVGKCIREVIAGGIVRTVRNNYIHCVAEGTGFGLKARRCMCLYIMRAT